MGAHTQAFRRCLIPFFKQLVKHLKLKSFFKRNNLLIYKIYCVGYFMRLTV